VLLGLGSDGHCGSNHPNSAAAINADKLAVAASPGEPSSITMTFETINAAKSVVFVVVGGGKGKKEAVARALKRPAESRGTFPAQGIVSPLFVMDEEAAAGL
jgi:6-phosphogluconolactonase/glucosamine-6-phosphate isomerase/deaminase